MGSIERLRQPEEPVSVRKIIEAFIQGGPVFEDPQDLSTETRRAHDLINQYLASISGRVQVQEYLAKWGEPKPIITLDESFNHRKLFKEADRRVSNDPHVKEYYFLQPEDVIPEKGITWRVSKMAEIFLEHMRDVYSRVRKKRFFGNDLYGENGVIVYILDESSDPRKFWLGDYLYIGRWTRPDHANQEEILAIARHGQVWFMYTDDMAHYPGFTAWVYMDKQYLPEKSDRKPKTAIKSCPKCEDESLGSFRGNGNLNLVTCLNCGWRRKGADKELWEIHLKIKEDESAVVAKQQGENKKQEWARRRELKRLEEAERLAEAKSQKLTQDTLYIMDALILGYGRPEIEGTLVGEDTDYLKLCFNIAEQNKIKRRVELERGKIAGPYAIAASIDRVAGEIRGFARTVATGMIELTRSNMEVAMALDNLGFAVQGGLQAVASSNIEAGRMVSAGLSEIALSNVRVAEVIDINVGRLATEATRLNNFREFIYEEAQRARVQPLVGNYGTNREILIVNNYNGTSVVIKGASVYQDEHSYVIRTYEGTIVLPKHTHTVLDPRSGSLKDFQKTIRHLPPAGNQ